MMIFTLQFMGPFLGEMKKLTQLPRGLFWDAVCLSDHQQVSPPGVTEIVRDLHLPLIFLPPAAPLHLVSEWITLLRLMDPQEHSDLICSSPRDAAAEFNSLPSQCGFTAAAASWDDDAAAALHHPTLRDQSRETEEMFLKHTQRFQYNVSTDTLKLFISATNEAQSSDLPARYCLVTVKLFQKSVGVFIILISSSFWCLVKYISFSSFWSVDQIPFQFLDCSTELHSHFMYLS